MSILNNIDTNSLTQSAEPYANARARYRIVEETLYNGEKRYRLEKFRRIFVIGPYKWISYKVHPNHYYDDYDFALTGTTNTYATLDLAQKDLDDLVRHDLNKVKSKKILYITSEVLEDVDMNQ